MIPTNFRDACVAKSGTSLGDSGSAYGYHWQQPAVSEDFPLEYADPSEWTDNETGKRTVEAGCRISLPMALGNAFSIDPRATQVFRRWANLSGHDGKSWFELSREYVKLRASKDRYNDYSDGPMHMNTYNSETDFDQVVEIHSPSLYAEWHVLHIHTGCDVRGGYADPIIVLGDLEEFICADRVSFYCQCGEGAENEYDAQRAGWKLRINKRTLSIVCPKCKHVAMSLPLAKEVLKKAA